MTIEELDAQFSDRFVTGRGPMLLLSGRDGIDYINQALSHSWKVIGVEGFHLLPTGAIQPDSRLELGTEDCPDLDQLALKILDFLNEWKDDLTIAFEIYLDDVQRMAISALRSQSERWTQIGLMWSKGLEETPELVEAIRVAKEYLIKVAATHEIGISAPDIRKAPLAELAVGQWWTSWYRVRH